MTDHSLAVTQKSYVSPDLAVLVSECVLQTRVRRQILQAQLRLDNQIAALERLKVGKLKGAKATVTVTAEQKAAIRLILPHLEPGAAQLARARKQTEKALVVAAKRLPVAAWIAKTPGLGLLGLSLIVGEAGDLSHYANPAKLWKRFGLAVLGGERQRRVAGKTPVTKALAILHGFSPHRRTLLHVIGDACMKQRRSPYRAVYDGRKTYEWDRLPEVKGRKGHAHMRALRYMEKRIVRDLWTAWRSGEDQPTAETQETVVLTAPSSAPLMGSAGLFG